jgi:hypothetical protein
VKEWWQSIFGDHPLAIEPALKERTEENLVDINPPTLQVQGEAINHEPSGVLVPSKEIQSDDFVIDNELPDPSNESESDDNLIGDEIKDQLQMLDSDNDCSFEPCPSSTCPSSPVHLVQRPKFAELLTFLDPCAIFKHLPIDDVIRARGISQHMLGIVDDYFLHRILSRTEIVFGVKYYHDIDGRRELEYQRLQPVIQRIEKQKRHLPHGRMLYEPVNDSGRTYLYRHGSFEPVAIDFRLPDDIYKYSWPLVAMPDDIGRYRSRYKRQSYLKYTKIYQYYKFQTFKDSPVQVFYKDYRGNGPDGFTLHALSIPLNYLRHALSTKYGRTI